MLPPNRTTPQPELLFKTFYFLFFAAAASLFPFIVLFYKQLGLSGSQIGVLTAIPPLITLFAASLWGGLADATQQHRRLLALALSGVIILALVILSLTTFLALMLGTIAFAFFFAPIIPLVDNSALESLGQRRSQYGKLRLWGAIGWGVAAPLVGRLAEQFGLGWLFYGYVLFMLAGLLVSFRLPISRTPLGQSFGQGVRRLLSNRQWSSFLGLIFMIGLGAAVINNYLFLYMEQLGAGKTLMGLALSVATLSEVTVFLFSDRLLDRWGAYPILMLSMAALAVRLLAYAVTPNPWLILPAQLLHGLTFAAMWAAGVAYVHKIAPPGLGATAQGLMSGVAFGAAAAAGGLLGGLLYESIGLALTFGLGGLALLGVLLLFMKTLPASG
jgi:PPP family 3-phenylpropionic acid transporter